MSIAEILEKKLNDATGNKEVLSVSELRTSGICQSLSAAKKLLQSSGISSIRIGNKTLFSKSDLIKYFHKSVS